MNQDDNDQENLDLTPEPEEDLKPVEKGNDNAPLAHSYKKWFLEYASYVILDRAVPTLNDGLKPVQRRILHSLRELDDGRYNKVANVVGHTMRYHPHGDASIYSACLLYTSEAADE